ncbi:MAG TPA: tol-pal system protein YbgF [Rhizomicrobium sp.]|jgi:tol-pal system protein YbgF
MMNRQRLLISTFAICLGALPLASPASAQLFGPSDDQKAQESDQDAAIKDLQNQNQQLDARVRGLEDKVRGLTGSLSQTTGSNEELQHQIQQQNDKIDRMQKDFAYRLCTLSAQQLGAGDSMNCAAAGTPSAGMPQSAPPPSGMQPGAPLPPIDATGGNNGASNFNSGPVEDNGPVRGRPPGTLGTLSSGPSYGGANSAPAALGPAPQGAPAGGNSAQYDQAMNLMSRAQYDEASAAFRSYADANPDDTDLSPQSIYWVANISFIRQNYAPAARSFAEVIKKYPKSTRAPDAMLKLAQSFMAMGQKSEGCTTLGLIKTKYPNASPQTLATAVSLRKTACSK